MGHPQLFQCHIAWEIGQHVETGVNFIPATRNFHLSQPLNRHAQIMVVCGLMELGEGSTRNKV
jgi:hypothetical protein